MSDEAVRCAWCDLPAMGWARVEPGYGVGQPSCGKHGAQYEPDETLFDRMLSEHDRAVAEKAWDEGSQATWDGAVWLNKSLREYGVPSFVENPHRPLSVSHRNDTSKDADA